MKPSRQPGDVVVVSIHWGPNWGYRVPSSHRKFAKALVDEVGVDVIHGHSAHHPIGFEMYHGSLILYGCGDLLTDYEGIRGHEEFRPELSGWYIVTFDTVSGELEDFKIMPTKVHRFQLVRPAADEIEWLARLLEEQGPDRGIRIEPRGDVLAVDW